MKKLFTILFSFMMIFILKAQDKQAPVEILYPEDAFKYDQVLPPYQTPDHHPDCENYILDVMFKDEAIVRLRNGELTDLRTDATVGIKSILDELTWFEWERFSEVSEELLDELSENGSRSSGQPVYNLNNIYRLRVPEQQNIWDLSTSLESLQGIIYARPVPRPAELPVPPNYQNNQGYLDPAVDVPSGIDAEYAWTKPGGTGTGIKICDLEYSWNYNHADVTKAVGSQINSNVEDPFNSTHHGTAVIGVLVSNNNGWGTTGATYNSSLRTCGTYYGAPSPTYNPAGAITLSISNLVAGDIILLEQQSDYTGSDGYVPIEWYGNYSPNAQTNNPVYAAIVNAVANGIHVVEAGGNGNVNTGNLIWFGNSGAVIVGAGGGGAGNNLRKLNFSSYGPRFDVQGWGENVTTTGYGGLYNAEGINYYYTSSFNGTSSASPIVTSAIACFSGYWKSNVSAIPPSPSNMRAILKRHGRPQVNPSDGYIGTRPNLEAMIKGYMYCTASGGCDEYISRVQMGDIDNSSDCDGGYVDYTSIYSTNLSLNLSQTLTVTNGNPYSPDQCGVWIDWNRDGDFSDASETISVSGTPGNGPYTATITPPATATIGDVRMRVRITYTGSVSACGTTQYGEVEDYTITLSAAAPNYWTGATNYYWHNTGNWSLGHIPTAAERAVITSNGYHPPSTGTTNETIGSLEIQPGASLKVHQGQLTVNQDMDISGQLWIDYDGAVMNCYGNVNWKSGATANFQQSNVFWVYGNWEFQAGSNVQLAAGNVDFIGSNTSWIRVYAPNSSFYNLGSYKSGTAWARVSDLSNYDLEIDGYLYIHSNARFGISSNEDVILKGNILQNGEFDFTGAFNTGNFIFDGAYQNIIMNTPDGLFNNVKFSATGSVSTNGNFNAAGNILIESGNFNPQGNTITVTGDWQTSVGPNGFVEAGSRIIFNGPGHQYIYGDENFDILEVNNGAALRLNSTAYDVTCNTYDWTSGGIDIVTGNFTALDLADNGLYGTFWCNPYGTINLTQDDAQYTDLNGEIHIFGGTMTVNGGLGASYWPYAGNALIIMTGGVLDFPDNPIRLSTSSYTFSNNIQGGTIRSQWGFWDYRGDYTPTGGTLEFYGNADASLFLTPGSNLYDLRINKIAADGDAPAIENEFIQYRNGTKEPVNRGNMVTATSDLLILNDFTIDGGTFTAPSLITIGGVDGGDWVNNVSPDAFVEGTGKVSFIGEYMQYCSSEHFNVLELNKPNGDFTIINGNNVVSESLQWVGAGEIYVINGVFTALDLFDNGIFGKYFINGPAAEINLYQDDSQWVDLNAVILINNGILNIYGGSGTSFWPYSANAELTMHNGVLNFADNGIYINGYSVYNLDMNITGGVIKTVGGMYGDGDNFQPTGGEVELYGPDNAAVGIYGASYFNDLVINKGVLEKSANSYDAKPSKGQTNAPEREEPNPGNTRANIVNATAHFNVEQNLIIENGIFDVSSFDVQVDNNLDIFGTLKMMDPAGSITCYTINWQSGSEDLIDAGNIYCNIWNFNSGTLAQLGTGNLAHVYSGFTILDEGGEIGNLEMGMPGSKFIFKPDRGSALNTAGYATLLSGSDWYFNVPMNIGTDFTVEETASFEINDNLTVDNDLILQGEIVFNGDLALIHGGLNFPSTGSLTINGGDFILDAPYNFSKAWFFIYGSFTLPDGLFEISNNSISFGSTATTNISGGILRSGVGFQAANSPGIFVPTGGLVELTGQVADGNIICFPGNAFYNLTINSAALNSNHYTEDLTVNNDFTILAGGLVNGYFYFDTYQMYVGGDWTDNTGGFVPNAGNVKFFGSFQSNIFTDETFYNLDIDKSWAGANDAVIADGAYIGVQNDLEIQFGGLEPGAAATVDIGHNIIIANNGLLTVPSNTTCDILVGGNWSNANTVNNTTKGFNPGWSTVTFNGSILQEHQTNAIMDNFYNLVLENNGGSLILGGFTQFFGDVQILAGALWDNSDSYIHYFHGDVTVEPDGAFLPNSMIDFIGANDAVFRDNSAGDSYIKNDVWIEKDDPATVLVLESQMKPLNDASLHVVEGTLDLNGNYIRCVGNVTIYENGTMNIDAGASLEVGNNKALTVKNGGILEVLGSPVASAKVTAWNSVLGFKYLFNIESGGTIRADNAIFEYMGGINGVNVMDGAIVDPTYCFNTCIFRNGSGETNSALLVINNDQVLTIDNASFPDFSASFNVAKDINQGHLTFTNFTGAFAGEDHDYDPSNIVDWYVPTLEAVPLVQNVGAPAGSTTFDIISTLEWTAFENSAWFSISPGSGIGNGILTVTYQANNTFFPRTSEILLTADDVPDVILTVIQEAMEPILSVTPALRNVSATAGSTTFSLTSNTSWTVSESVGWFSVSPMSGVNNNTLVVDYQENASVTSRTGQITISASGVPDVVVTVIQAGTEPYIEIWPDVEYISAAAGSIPFNLSSNTDWEINESYGWLSMNPASGVGNAVITVDYEQNATGTPRQAVVTITANGGTLSVDYTISQETYYTHQVSIPGGWSGLSSYIRPVETGIEDVMSPILPDFTILQTMVEIYYPAGGINTIVNWDLQSAYKIKLSNASVLDILGVEENNKTFLLDGGWNLVPVISNIAVDAETLFAGSDYRIIKDVAGPGILWPDYGINTLGVFVPGKAYFALMNSSGSVTFPPNAKNAEPVYIPEIKVPANPWTDNTAGPSTHVIALLAQGFSGVLEGDLIGLFAEDGNCYGISEIQSLSQNTVISANADDPYTNAQDGFVSGNHMGLKLFRSRTGEVFEVNAVWDDQQPNTSFFSNEGISVISGFKVSTLGLSDALTNGISIYPNPTNGTVWITGIRGYHEVTLMNNTGMILLTRENNEQDKTCINMSSLSSGIYQVRLTGEKSTIIRKVIKN